jgi:2-dehydro-3-deoxyglucarate aldolase/4-hydroxy-2-oxoheptanedioate aldolase
MSSTLPFRQRVLAGETLLGTFVMMGSRVAAELAARSGLDWVLIDLEHGMAGESDLLGLLQAVQGTGATPIVRVERTERLRVGRALDLGAMGIMAPQVSGAEEARRLAAYLRYQPGGERGIMVFSRGLEWGAGGHPSVKERHAALTGIAQIETPAAVDAAADIAAIEGVDVLFVGPADLSHAMGIPGNIADPAFDRAIRRVADAARGAGKAAGVMLWKPEDAARFRDAGYTVFSLSNEGAIFNAAMRGFVDGARRSLGG